MNKIRLTGWLYGLNKISLTKTIRARLSLGLAEAKHHTDQMLEGNEVILEVPDADAANALAHELNALGADVVCDFHEGP